jgi:ankyrin repeat protein
MQDFNGYSALHWACSSGSYQAVRYLLAFQANVNLQTVSCGSTPLVLSIKAMDNICEPRTIHKLMLYGADPNIKDSSFRSC